MALPAIRVEGLGKRYRLAHGQELSRYRTLRDSIVSFVTAPLRKRGTVEEFWALNDVSFEVQPGEVVGIIGRNGAGKSTLLKILSRITKPTKGRVEINGRVGSLLEVGTGFHPELTGRENVYLNGSILGMSRREIEQKFDEIVAFAAIEQFLDTPVKRYSSGMYVRLAFAVAAHLEPEILIVDEVLAVGDAEFQNRCMNKMNAISHSGRTILFVSHNMAAIENLCTRAVLLSGGRVAAAGHVSNIIAEYRKRDRIIGESMVDLSTHPNRRGGTHAHLTRLWLSSDNEACAAIQMDKPLEITIEYDCGRVPIDLKLGISIEDQRGVQIVNFATIWQAPTLLRSSPPRAGVKCVIPRITLVRGLYSINIFYDDGFDIEAVTNACEVEVIPSDVFGTGQFPEARFGLVYMDCKWEKNQMMS